MKCSDIDRVLGFENEAEAPDLHRVRSHLAQCLRCATDYPDASLLLGANPGRTLSRQPRFAKPALAAAAAAIAIGIYFGLSADASVPASVETEPAPVSAPSIAAPRERNSALDRGRITAYVAVVHPGATGGQPKRLTTSYTVSRSRP